MSIVQASLTGNSKTQYKGYIVSDINLIPQIKKLLEIGKYISATFPPQYGNCDIYESIQIGLPVAYYGLITSTNVPDEKDEKDEKDNTVLIYLAIFTIFIITILFLARYYKVI